jgi:hypothetical protein
MVRRQFVVAALVLFAGMGAAAQQTEPAKLALAQQQITIRFNDEALGDVMAAFANHFGIVIEYAPDITDAEKTPLVRAVFDKATFQDAASFLLDRHGLVYKVIDSRTIRIEHKAP